MSRFAVLCSVLVLSLALIGVSAEAASPAKPRTGPWKLDYGSFALKKQGHKLVIVNFKYRFTNYAGCPSGKIAKIQAKLPIKNTGGIYRTYIFGKLKGNTVYPVKVPMKVDGKPVKNGKLALTWQYDDLTKILGGSVGFDAPDGGTDCLQSIVFGKHK